jgi:hypothetical protein
MEVHRVWMVPRYLLVKRDLVPGNNTTGFPVPGTTVSVLYL